MSLAYSLRTLDAGLPGFSFTAHLSILDGARRKWVPYTLSLPLWEKSQARKVFLGDELCCPGGGLMWIK